MTSNAEALSRVPLFGDLTSSELGLLAPRFREDRFDRNTHVFREGDPVARFWVVKDGQVKIVKYGEGGREVVIEVILPGETFGGATMLMPRYPATAVTLSETTTLSLSVEEYRAALRDFPSVAVRVIEAMGERMLGMIKVRTMAAERVEKRIAHILLKLASKIGQETDEGWVIGASLTRQDIAELADTTVETAIRVMSRFSKEGLARTLRGGFVVIVDRAALEQIASGE